MTKLFRFSSWVYKISVWYSCMTIETLLYSKTNNELQTFDILIAICYSNTNNMWRFYFVDRRRLKISPQPDDACHSRAEDDRENFKPPAVYTQFDYYTIIRTSKFYFKTTDAIILQFYYISEYLYMIISYFCVLKISYIIATSC